MKKCVMAGCNHLERSQISAGRHRISTFGQGGLYRRGPLFPFTDLKPYRIGQCGGRAFSGNGSPLRIAQDIPQKIRAVSRDYRYASGESFDGSCRPTFIFRCDKQDIGFVKFLSDGPNEAGKPHPFGEAESLDPGLDLRPVRAIADNREDAIHIRQQAPQCIDSEGHVLLRFNTTDRNEAEWPSARREPFDRQDSYRVRYRRIKNSCLPETRTGQLPALGFKACRHGDQPGKGRQIGTHQWPCEAWQQASLTELGQERVADLPDDWNVRKVLPECMRKHEMKIAGNEDDIGFYAFYRTNHLAPQSEAGKHASSNLRLKKCNSHQVGKVSFETSIGCTDYEIDLNADFGPLLGQSAGMDFRPSSRKIVQRDKNLSHSAHRTHSEEFKPYRNAAAPQPSSVGYGHRSVCGAWIGKVPDRTSVSTQEEDDGANIAKLKFDETAARDQSPRFTVEIASHGYRALMEGLAHA